MERQFKYNLAHEQRLFCQYDEMSADNPHNQVIKRVLRLMMTAPAGLPARKKLSELLMRFDPILDVDYPECENHVIAWKIHRAAIPEQIVKRVFFVTRATTTATRAPVIRPLDREMFTTPCWLTTAGTIRADKAAGGTNRRSRENESDISILPISWIRDSRMAKVPAPISKNNAQIQIVYESIVSYSNSII